MKCKSGILRILLVGLVMTMVALKGGGPVAVGLWLSSLVLGWPSGKWMATEL